MESLRQPPEILLVARRALDELNSVVILKDWEWYEHVEQWMLYCRISIDIYLAASFHNQPIGMFRLIQNTRGEIFSSILLKKAGLRKLFLIRCLTAILLVKFLGVLVRSV